jgi:hypothetical protein
VESLWAVVIAIVPSIGVGFLFYKVLKAIIEGDRKERLAHAQWEAHQEAESVNIPSDSGPAASGAPDQPIRR